MVPIEGWQGRTRCVWCRLWRNHIQQENFPSTIQAIQLNRQMIIVQWTVDQRPMALPVIEGVEVLVKTIRCQHHNQTPTNSLRKCQKKKSRNLFEKIKKNGNSHQKTMPNIDCAYDRMTIQLFPTFCESDVSLLQQSIRMLSLIISFAKWTDRQTQHIRSNSVEMIKSFYLSETTNGFDASTSSQSRIFECLCLNDVSNQPETTHLIQNGDGRTNS